MNAKEITEGSAVRIRRGSYAPITGRVVEIDQWGRVRIDRFDGDRSHEWYKPSVVTVIDEPTTEQAEPTMTSEQATNEALLRIVRKFRRLHRGAYIDVMSQLPREAHEALRKAELAADVLRDTHPATIEGLTGLDWPAEPNYDDEV